MSMRVRVGIGAVFIAVASTAATSSVEAHPIVRSAPTQHVRDTDYAQPKTDVLRASGFQQCRLPLSKRKGHWVCFSDAAGDSSQKVDSRGTDSEQLDSSKTSDGTYCEENENVCWFVTDRYYAHNFVKGDFGLGGTDFGHVNLTQSHSLNGAQFITKVFFYTNTDIDFVQAQGSLLHGSHTTIGQIVDGTNEYSSTMYLDDGDTWRPFANGIYKSYSKSDLNHANIVEITWKKGSISGYWYVYQKSNIATDPDNNNYYDFVRAIYLFKSSVGSGHHAD